MWKKISVVTGGMALAVALPFVALAVTTDEFPDVTRPAEAAPAAVQATTQTQAIAAVAPVEPTGPWVSPNVPDPVATQQASQTMVRQQLRVHSETGPPEGSEPVQQRLHTDDPLGMGPGDDTQGQHMNHGNPDAPMVGAGTGDCTANGADCPNAGESDQAMQNQRMQDRQSQNQEQNTVQNQEMVKGNPDAPGAGAGTGDPDDCPNDGQAQDQRGAGNPEKGGRNG